MKASGSQMIVVGAGLSGLMAALRVAEAGASVCLISRDPPARSDSAALHLPFSLASGGKGSPNSAEKHFLDTIATGDFLANQEPVRKFCFASPSLLALLQRMGVFFDRGDDGLLESSESEGWHRSSAIQGNDLGRKILHTLDGQVRRYEGEGRIVRRIGWEFLSAILDEGGVCRGVVVMDTRSMQCEAIPGEGVIVATGGIGSLFGHSSQGSRGGAGAVSVLYQQGAPLANPEMIQFFPSVPISDSKTVAVGATFLSRGGRLFVNRNGSRWYFMEELHSKMKGSLPHDVTCRAIDRVTREMGLGLNGGPTVCLEIPKNLEPALGNRWGPLWPTIKKMMISDHGDAILPVLPSVAYWLGGLWTDENQMTGIPGLFAAGECQCQFHGANLLEGNLIPASLYSGWKAAEGVLQYRAGPVSDRSASSADAETAVARARETIAALRDGSGKENLPHLMRELRQTMATHVAMGRKNERLREVDEKLLELSQRSHRITLSDPSGFMNEEVREAASFRPRLELSRAIAKAALLRNETRGCHDKPDYPKRDDAAFLKTSKVYWSPEAPRVEYEDVNLKFVKP